MNDDVNPKEESGIDRLYRERKEAIAEARKAKEAAKEEPQPIKLFLIYAILYLGLLFMIFFLGLGHIIISINNWLETGVWHMYSLFDMLSDISDDPSSDPFDDWVRIQKILKFLPIWVLSIPFVGIFWEILKEQLDNRSRDQ